MAKLPEKGQTLWGFTVTERNSISMLGAETAELFHPFSGARLLYIHNDDRELGFNLIYRTPQLDNLDSNHIRAFDALFLPFLSQPGCVL
jgi:Zn-dependent M16 (insulinase) family peptidase